MPCNVLKFPGGTTAIVCTRTRQRPFVCACGQRATLQCDAPTKRRSGTCDRHLCEACAAEIGPDQHLCPTHSAERASAQAAKPVEQLDLFA
jgi:hypothetical protein